MSLTEIITSGNRGYSLEQIRAGVKGPDNNIRCADGFTVSVIAGAGCYCTPRPNRWDGTGGPYAEVEVGFPSATPTPWDVWSQYVEDADDPTNTVYAYVPVEHVRALIDAHGGEV